MKHTYKFKPNYLFCTILTLVLLCTVTWKTAANDAGRKMFDSPLTTWQDTIKRKLVTTDTPPQLRVIGTDTTKRININDSLQQFQTTDTFVLKLSKDSLDAPVKYQAEDSAVILVQEKTIILYGKTQTDYKDITLKAPMVILDQQTQVLTAVHSTDSLGVSIDYAQFRQGQNEFFSDTIRFNFKTQKGLTKNTITQQGEMYIHAGTSKKVDANTTFISEGLFTTCNLDEPHFAFKANKLKVINQKLAVSGPAHPEFEGVPFHVFEYAMEDPS